MRMKNKKRKALSPKDVAEIYSLSEGSLANMRSRREGPRYYKIGRKVIYFITDIEDWLKRTPVLTIDSLPE